MFLLVEPFRWRRCSFKIKYRSQFITDERKFWNRNLFPRKFVKNTARRRCTLLFSFKRGAWGNLVHFFAGFIVCSCLTFMFMAPKVHDILCTQGAVCKNRKGKLIIYSFIPWHGLGVRRPWSNRTATLPIDHAFAFSFISLLPKSRLNF